MLVGLLISVSLTDDADGDVAEFGLTGSSDARGTGELDPRFIS